MKPHVTFTREPMGSLSVKRLRTSHRSNLGRPPVVSAQLAGDTWPMKPYGPTSDGLVGITLSEA